MKKLLVFILVCLNFVSLNTHVWAQESLQIEGNGSGSNSDIVVESGSDIQVIQNNQTFIQNNIESHSNTGNNNSNSGNIKTGSSSTSIEVVNIGGANITNISCCVSPTPKPTPLPIPQSPKPSTSPSVEGSPSSGNSSSPARVGGGEILGLSATSATDPLSLSSILLPPHFDSSNFVSNFNDQPSKISIPSINVSLEIVESRIENGYWQVSKNFANHGQGTANIGDKSNMVIFAHARPGLFANLFNLNLNDKITVSSVAINKEYVVKDLKVVDDTNLNPILDHQSEELTLFTCVGNTSKRLVVTALPM